MALHRLGMIACGGISYAHGNGAVEWDDIEFVACCDIRKDAAEAWAKKYNCPAVYEDYREMIAKEELDGVVLCTWPNQHREQLGGCLDAGTRNILCEKSLTTTASDAREVWQLVNDTGAFVLEAPAYFHHPRMQELRKHLAEHDYGPAVSARAVFSYFDPEEPAADDGTRNWRRKKECAGGSPWDFASYPVNACGWAVKSLPVRAYCTGRRSEKYDVINYMRGIIEYANGTTGMIESDKHSMSQEFQIVFNHHLVDLHTAVWSNRGDESYEFRVRENDGPIDGNVTRCRPGDRFAAQLRHFCDAIDGKAAPLIPLVQSVVNMHALDALVTGIDTRMPVDMEIPDDVAAAFRRDVRTDWSL
jgi:predicted dehydrogenase